MVVIEIKNSHHITPHHKEIKNHPERVPNIKLYGLAGIEYPTSINKNNYTLFEKNNLEITLIVCILM